MLYSCMPAWESLSSRALSIVGGRPPGRRVGGGARTKKGRTLTEQEHKAEKRHDISQYNIKFQTRDCLHQAHQNSQVGQSLDVRHKSLSKELV